jgi:hypothetical protein
MKRNHKFLLILIGLSLTTGLSISLAWGQSQALKAEEPVLIASCGQSPAPVMLKVILQKLKVNFEFTPLATPQDLKTKKDAGTPYKTLIVTMGASLKGMGAAGISIDDELKRTGELIDEARREGIKIIGAHIEGMKRRAQGAAAGDTTDEQSIDAVAPKSDLLVVNKEGNADGRFTTIANEKKIPLIEVEKNLDLLAQLGKLFQK